jgi:hypothetical protein
MRRVDLLRDALASAFVEIDDRDARAFAREPYGDSLRR